IERGELLPDRSLPQTVHDFDVDQPQYSEHAEADRGLAATGQIAEQRPQREAKAERDDQSIAHVLIDVEHVLWQSRALAHRHGVAVADIPGCRVDDHLRTEPLDPRGDMCN